MHQIWLFGERGEWLPSFLQTTGIPEETINPIKNPVIAIPRVATEEEHHRFDMRPRGRNDREKVLILWREA
jgi:hypothetical protein